MGDNPFEIELFDPPTSEELEKWVYTCRCGWIDKGHARSKIVVGKPTLGARSLWKQVIEESGKKSLTGKGFKVTFREQMGLTIAGVSIVAGEEESFFVRSGLTLSQKESVALAIFLHVSEKFESLQETLKLSSAYGADDLPSNLVGFYDALRPLDKHPIVSNTKYIRDVCKEVSVAETIAIWQAFGPPEDLPKVRNLANVYDSKRLFKSNCCETCSSLGDVLGFPKELQSIVPDKLGSSTHVRVWRTAVVWQDVTGDYPAVPGADELVFLKRGPLGPKI